MQKRIERIGLFITLDEKRILTQLSELEGLSKAATLRRLLRQAAQENGMWPERPETITNQLFREVNNESAPKTTYL